MNTNSNENQSIFCDLTVFPQSVREQIATATPDIFQAVQTVQELTNGYAFQFPNEPNRFMMMAQFIELERQCCPFYSFALEIEPNGGSIWLRMTGDKGVKEFMQTVWNDLQGSVSKQLMRTGPSNDLDEVIAQGAPILANTLQKAVPHSKDKD